MLHELLLYQELMRLMRLLNQLSRLLLILLLILHLYRVEQLLLLMQEQTQYLDGMMLHEHMKTLLLLKFVQQLD